MNWNDYESAWKRQEPPVEVKADLPALRQTLEAKRRKLARTLFWRDAREAVAGLFVSAIFATRAWHLGKAGWPIALAVALILSLSAFFIWERFRARKSRVRPEAPVLAKLDSDIAELRHQRHLLLNVALWYLAPCIAAIILVRVSTVKNPFAHPNYWVFLGILSWGIWALNRRAVRKVIEPRITELEKLRTDFLASE